MNGEPASPDPTAEVADLVERIFGTRVDGPPELQVRGYGNKSWRVRVGGADYLVKVAACEADIEKVTAASRAYGLAATTAAPVPKVVHFDPRCELLGQRTVRILEFMPGRRCQRDHRP